MKKFLGIVVLGLLFTNQAKAGTYELHNCFQGSNTMWSNPTKFYDLKHRYEESSWSINISTGLITRIEIFHQKYVDKINKDAFGGDKTQKEEFTEYEITNFTSNLILGKKYITDPALKELLVNPNAKVVHDALRINLNDSIVKIITLPDGAKYFDYDIVNRIYGGKLDYREFQELFKTETRVIKCEKSSSGSETDEASVSSGTAFFINKKGNLLTNNHVVEECKSQKINYFDKEYEATLIATDKTLDLALLKAKVKPKSYISFSKEEPKKRQEITVAGYPLGKGLSDDLKINDGRISSLKGFENNSNEITVDIAINPGNSGGPIVNEKGQLVAIAVAGMSKDVTEGINFGIKASAAANFLKSNKISPSVGYMSFSMGEDKLVKLLEESTVYTFCN